MASLSSVTGTLSSTASLRGYGGLSSGLDRDSLIESLTYGTRSKIEAQQAKKEKVEWEQSAIRSIIDKVYNFSNTYLSYSSSSNLTASTLFSRTSIFTTGEYSKYVSASGTMNTGSEFSVLGVQQLASDAKLTGSTASSSMLTTGTLNLDEAFDEDLINGSYLTFTVGESKTFSIDLGSVKNTDAYKSSGKVTDAAIEEMLNNAIKKAQTDDDATDLTIKAEVKDGVVSFKNESSNRIEISGGSKKALEALGFSTDEAKENMTGAAYDVDGIVKTHEKASEYLAGKTVTFTYNGVRKDIELGDDVSTPEALKKALQEGLDDAFGKGRIQVGTENGALTFQTMNVQNGGIDKTSTLTITGGSAGLLGSDGILAVKSGASNRIDLSKSLAEAGLANAGELKEISIDDAGTRGYSMVINGERFAFAKDASVQDIIDTVNKSDAGVKISYSSSSDKFSIISTEKGASGEIKMYGGIAEALFGPDHFTTDQAGNSWDAAVIKGQDAVIAVQYAGDDEPTMIYRDSNSFTMDGLTVNVSGTFGFEQDVAGEWKLSNTEAVKIEANVNVDKAVDTIKNMVNAYNEIITLINGELKAKPDNDYKSPLTGSQKEDMSEDEIEEYNKKAKTGLLYGDSDLRNFALELRTVIGGNAFALSEIGISESSEYSDNGKLVIDEEKLKAALQSNPEKVDELFNKTAEAGGTAGFMTNIKAVTEKYCKTMGATKGLLVERAGSEHSPLSLLSNTMKTQMDDISDYIERLLDRLEAEEDRYISQFTSLETLISQMNSQSSYLAGLNSSY